MKTTQALITVGGKGTRLQAGGIEVPLSKSFLEIKGKPIFYWCLRGLYDAGITKLVVLGDSSQKLEEAKKIVDLFPKKFFKIDFFYFPTIGTIGVPYHVKHLLEENFFFETGHGITHPSHYALMDNKKTRDKIVFSVFFKRLNNERKKVFVDEKEMTVGLPFLLNMEYVKNLPRMGFDIEKIIAYYSKENKLSLVKNIIPEEFDTKEDYEEMIPIYEKMIQDYKWE